MLTTLAILGAMALSSANAASQGLFGMSEQIQLGKIDTKAGTFSGIGAPCPYEAQAQELSSIDSKKGKLADTVGARRDLIAYLTPNDAVDSHCF